MTGSTTIADYPRSSYDFIETTILFKLSVNFLAHALVAESIYDVISFLTS